MFNQKLKEFKKRQAEINGQMQNYTDADETFYLTAGKILNIAQRADEILKSSEPAEKRQFINFVFQNLVLDGKNLQFELKTPFNTVLQATISTSGLPILDTFRMVDWKLVEEQIKKFELVFGV